MAEESLLYFFICDGYGDDDSFLLRELAFDVFMLGNFIVVVFADPDDFDVVANGGRDIFEGGCGGIRVENSDNDDNGRKTHDVDDEDDDFSIGIG